MGKKDNNIKHDKLLTPPIIGGLLGGKTRHKATDKKTGKSSWGSSFTEAKKYLKKKK